MNPLDTYGSVMEGTPNDDTFHASSLLRGLRHTSVTTFFLRSELEKALGAKAAGNPERVHREMMHTEPAELLDTSVSPLLCEHGREYLEDREEEKQAPCEEPSLDQPESPPASDTATAGDDTSFSF